MNTDIIPIFFSNTLALALWEGGLFGGLAALAVACIVYLKYRVNVIKNEKAGLQQLVHERSELLKYSTENEKKAKENAHHANQEKSLLLARINHEIRTPLNGILGMVALLEETSQTSEQREYNETIRDCGDTLLQVVNDILYNDILAYSKLESGKMELEKKDFNLESCIEDVLETLARKANHQNVELIYEIASEVPPQISGDLLRVRQILMNLVENSVKHTTDGEVQIAVSLNSAVSANPIELKFEVQDTGTGISAEKLKSLSSNIDVPTTANRSGLGLPISRKLIELMGGTLKIESNPEKGTRVTFTILASPGLVPARPALMPDLTGQKIVVALRNVRLTQLLKNLMEQWKLTPVMASSGEEVVAILSQQSDIALLLTDLKLKEMSGIDLAQQVNKMNPNLPLILLAPAGHPSLKQHPDLFDAVISKPVRRTTLNKQITSVLLHADDATSDSSPDRSHKLSENFSIAHPLRILIAEDNPTNQKLAMKVLGKLGYTPDIAQHGKEVLEIVSHKNYDLILMDVQMPLMDGLEASRMIRLCLSTQPVIIAMTANTLQGDREECMRAGMDDYISKPINLEELVNLLEKWALHINAKH